MTPKSIKTTRQPTTEEWKRLELCLANCLSYLCYVGLEEAAERKLQVCHSSAGYYIGATDEETGEPLSRDSMEYWMFREPAEIALRDFTWTQRLDA